MKLKSIQISNIWSFEYHDKIENAFKMYFNPDLNIIIGPNGAGKSNFVEIINQVSKRIITKNCKFEESNIDQVKNDPTGHYYYQTIVPEEIKADFKKNKYSHSEVQHIRLVLQLSDSDRINLTFIRERLSKIQTLIEKYVYPNTRPNFSDSISFEELIQFEELVIDVHRNGPLDPFSVTTSNNTDVENFILSYFQYFDILQYIIYLSNVHEFKENWPILKKTFALIGSYRNYNNISQSYLITNLKESKQNEILRLSKTEGTRLSTDNEPNIFIYVKHKLAYFFHEKRDQYANSTDENPINEKPLKSLENYSYFRSINDTLDQTLGMQIKIANKPMTLEYQFSFIDNDKNTIEISELSAGEKGILHFIFCIYGYDLENGLLVIDEPELHIHPQIQKRYLQIIEKVQKEFHI